MRRNIVLSCICRSSSFFCATSSLADRLSSEKIHLQDIRRVLPHALTSIPRLTISALRRREISIVPLLIGSISPSLEIHYGTLLAPHLNNPENLFIISSDFCHWGSRFRFTHYHSSATASAIPLTRSNAKMVREGGWEIHRSIRELDQRGMKSISVSRGKSAREAQRLFVEYLEETGNTICGRHPIGVLLAALSKIEETAVEGGEGGSELRWIRYEQSSAVTECEESSVSYAAGIVVRV